MPCREHLAQVREHYPAFQHLGAEVVGVTFEPAEQAARFAQAERLPFPVLSDPSRQAYAAFGLQRGKPRKVWNWNTAQAYLRGALQGRWPRPPHGDLEQLGGDVVLDREGRVVLVYRSEEPANRPAVSDLLAAVRRAADLRDDRSERV